MPHHIPDKPWLKNYDDDVLASLKPYPYKTLIDYLREGVLQRPHHAALLFNGHKISLQELDELSAQFASALIEWGFKKGDCLALLLPNCPQFMIAEIGVWKAGGIVLPLNPLYDGAELVDPLNTAEAQMIVSLTPFYGRVKSIQSQTSLKKVIATNIKEYLPASKKFLFTLFRERKEGHHIELQSNDLWLDDFLKCGKEKFHPAVEVKPEDPAVILLSGGTTGTPKGVLGHHHAFVITGLQFHHWLHSVVKEWEHVIMLPLSLFHSYGCVGAQGMALTAHLPLSLVPNPRDVNSLVKQITHEKPDHFFAVPTLLIGMMQTKMVREGKADFSSIKLCFSGAAALMADTKQSFEKLISGRIVEGYSLSEALIAVVVNPAKGVHKTGSVGMPLSDVEIQIYNPEDQKTIMPSGGVGEICFYAPQIMKGYWKDEEQTKIMLVEHEDGRVWLHTGDLGYLDEDGYLFIVDRMKDLIKTSGYQVWPREVEEVLTGHPDIVEAGVAGIPHPVRGEVVKAWIVRKEGSQLSAVDLRKYCKSKLAPYKAPGEYEFRTELPKSMIGKVLRRQLVAEELSKN